MRSLFPILSLIIAGILFFVVINPLYSDISQLRSDVATYNIALDNSTNLQRTQDALVTAYKNIKPEDKDRLSHFLPNTVNNIEFILEVEQIANLYGMPIKNIKFESPKPTTTTSTASAGSVLVTNNPATSRPYGVFSIEFATEGNYSTFASFLKDIEHNLRLIDVRQVSFIVPPKPIKPGDGPDPNIFTYNLKVDTYWLK